MDGREAVTAAAALLICWQADCAFIGLIGTYKVRIIFTRNASIALHESAAARCRIYC
jgi:hypothetical protein